MEIIKHLFPNAYKHFFVSAEHYQAETDELFSTGLKHYYVHPELDYLQYDINNNYQLDKLGIPVATFPGTDKNYNPVTIAQFALAHWELENSKSEPNYGTFLKLAGWFVKNHDQGRWRYFYEDKISNLPFGWISAMAQGQAISVLLRAYAVEQKEIYLQVCEKALQYFNNSVSNNGVTYKFDEQNWWFEEYPNPQNPAHVFNGHIFALFGIWDYFRVTANKQAKLLFERGLNAVINQITNYDNGWWALYDQRFQSILNASYLDLQIRQLEVLHALKPETIIRDYIIRWQNYQSDDHKLPKLVFMRLKQKLFS